MRSLICGELETIRIIPPVFGCIESRRYRRLTHPFHSPFSHPLTIASRNSRTAPNISLKKAASSPTGASDSETSRLAIDTSLSTNPGRHHRTVQPMATRSHKRPDSISWWHSVVDTGTRHRSIGSVLAAGSVHVSLVPVVRAKCDTWFSNTVISIVPPSFFGAFPQALTVQHGHARRHQCKEQ